MLKGNNWRMPRGKEKENNHGGRKPQLFFDSKSRRHKIKEKLNPFNKNKQKTTKQTNCAWKTSKKCQTKVNICNLYHTKK